MKTIAKLARLELSILFYSPIAWLLLILFTIQSGMAYTEKIGNYVTLQGLKVSKEMLAYATNKVFALPTEGMLPAIVNNLYLYLPLLTMGLVSRETSSGTIKLLYSSPVKVSQIILGKFLSMMVYNLLLIVILSFFVIAACLNISHADYGQLMAGMLGIYLLLCTYAAIGLFMSCLTSYQVIAALSTFAVFALLTYMGSIGQDIDFVRDLTYALAISNRTAHFLNGLVSTRDIIYFLVIIYIFLGLSMLKLLSGRESRSKLVIGGRYTALIVSAVLVSYLSAKPGIIGYYDATANKTESLAPVTQKIVQGIKDSSLEVVSYINLLDQRYWYGKPGMRNMDKDRWEPYLRFKPDISLKYVYYYDSIPDPQFFKRNSGKTLQQIAEDYANLQKADFSDFKSPAEVRKMADLTPEQNRYVMQLKLNGKSTFLRLYNDQRAFPSEAEIAAALQRMTIKLPKIAFLQGEMEYSAEKFGDRSVKPLTSDITFRYSLINQGFDVVTISLKDQDVPSDVTTLAIVDPLRDFDTLALARIKKYVDSGGNVLIAAEPGRQKQLNPLLQQLGVQLEDGMVVQPSRDLSPNLALTYLTPVAAGFSRAVKDKFQDSTRIAMPGLAVLSYQANGAYQVRPLLLTDKQHSWLQSGVTIDSNTQVTAPGKDDRRITAPAALALTRQVNGKEQRIVVTGDADFLSIFSMTKEHVDIANYSFNASLFGWLSYGRFPIDPERGKSKDDHATISPAGISKLKWLFMGIIPAILAAACAILLAIRKRK